MLKLVGKMESQGTPSFPVRVAFSRLCVSSVGWYEYVLCKYVVTQRLFAGSWCLDKALPMITLRSPEKPNG